MHAKLVIVGTLAGALTLFAWETVSNTALPWHTWTMRAFPDSNAAVQVIRTQAPANGMYVDGRGVVAAVAFAPDMRPPSLGVLMGRQFALDLAVAFVVLIVLAGLPRMSLPRYAAGTSLSSLAVSASVLVSNWNWYGFGLAWTAVNTIDRAIGYGLMGLALGAVINRFSGRARTDEWGGVGAPVSAYRPKVGSRTSGTLS